MKVKEESEKAGLKLNIQKTKIMASSLITSWQIDGETMETVRDFIFLGSEITAGGDCSHEIKRHLLLEEKDIKKQRHHFANKGTAPHGSIARLVCTPRLHSAPSVHPKAPQHLLVCTPRRHSSP